jgi:hypothetical protein
MKLRFLMKHLFIACLLIPINAAAEISLDGFQGLKWGSDTVDVIRKYPNATLDNSACYDPHLKEVYATKFSSDCNKYVIADYKVGEYIFRVSFGFTAKDKKLKSVHLSPANTENFEKLSRADIVNMSNFIESNLTDKYGASGKTSNVNNIHMFAIQSEWSFPKTSIRLDASFVKRALSFSVDYTAKQFGFAEAL